MASLRKFLDKTSLTNVIVVVTQEINELLESGLCP